MEAAEVFPLATAGKPIRKREICGEASYDCRARRCPSEAAVMEFALATVINEL